MKKLTGIILAACWVMAAAFTASSQTTASVITIQPGDKLIYEVNFRGDIYNFEVTVKTFGGSGIVFDYSMPSKSNSATIDISAEAVKNATIYHNYFNGVNQRFSDKSTVWLSRKNFKELLSGQSAMDMGAGSEAFEKKETVSFAFKKKGETVTASGFRADNGQNASDQRQLWIHNNDSNPLILKMDLGWTIELKEIIPAG